MRLSILLVPALALLFPQSAFSRIIDFEALTSCTGEDGTVVTRAGLGSCSVDTWTNALVTYEFFHGLVSAHAAGQSRATARLNVTEEFTTPGPPRAGLAYLFLRVSRYGDADAGGPVEAGVSVTDSGSFTTTHSTANCSGHICLSWDPQSPPAGLPEPVMFRLGEPFRTRVFATTDVIGSGEPDGREFSADFEIRLFEADGVTPVAMLDTPEPRTSLPLAAIALAFIAGTRRPRRE
jgi:hypothetical protein